MRLSKGFYQERRGSSQRSAEMASAAGGLLRDVAGAVFKNVKDPKMQGRIVGWVLAQLAVLMATAGAANAIKAGKLASIASKLDDLALLRDNPKLLQALKTAINKAEALALRKVPAAPSNVGGNLFAGVRGRI